MRLLKSAKRLPFRDVSEIYVCWYPDIGMAKANKCASIQGAEGQDEKR